MDTDAGNTVLYVSETWEVDKKSEVGRMKKMPYENLQLVVAGLSGEIYLSKVLKNGMMGESRRIATEDCLRATTEWFIKNEKKMIAYEHNSKGKKPSLFYTDDEEKAKQILEILKSN